MRVVAIHGLKGAGKDTVGQYLASAYGYTPMALAAKLKAFLEVVNPVIFDSAGYPRRLGTVLIASNGWDEAKRQHHGVRELLKTSGEAMKTIFGPEVWVYELLRSIEDIEEKNWAQLERLVVTDVRFSIELDELRAAFADDLVTVKITRPDHEPDGHVSEAGLRDMDFDYVIHNNDTIPMLFAAVDDLMESVL